MAESQKEAASTSKSQKNNSALDEEIDKEFLGSWKSMSMVEDDVLGFNCKTTSKGQKNTFNFDKLDMDFTIDGDFGKKLSSFKVDMSDLDFSSPPKRPLKPKERQKQESSSGKLKEKQDHFTFAFDFDELDNFDLDSTMVKGEKKSGKFVNNDSPIKNPEKQDSRNLFAKSTEAIENSTTYISSKLKHVDSKSECSTSAFGSLESQGDHYSMPRNFGNLNVSEGKNTPPHEEITNIINGEGHYKEVQMASSLATNGQDNIKYSCVQSVSGACANQESFQESEVDICPSVTEMKVILEGAADNSCKKNAGVEAKLVNSSNLDGSPLTCIAGPENINNEFENLGNQNGASPEFINRKESVQCDRGMARISQGKAHISVPTMERKISGSKFPLAQLLSGPKVNKDKLLTEKRPSSMCSSFIGGSEEPGFQINKTSTLKKIDTLSDKRNEKVHQVSADARRQDIITGDSKDEIKKFGTLNSHDGSETEVLAITLESVEKNEDYKASAGFQVHVNSSPKKATKLGSLRCIKSDLISSITLSKKSRSTSVEGSKTFPLEPGNKPLHVAGLNAPRSVSSNNSPFTPRLQKQIKSPWQSERKTKREDVAGKMADAVGTDIHGCSSPSMKRKISVEPNADPMTQHPLKRVTDVPNENRALEAMEKDNKQVGDNKNLPEDYHSISTLDASQDTCLIGLEVPSLMEHNGNVQKAEACTKELEDICKILKKKHEEAKEVLVRAIVNNNNLLILNHPSYEVKIRDFQRFAASMMSR